MVEGLQNTDAPDLAECLGKYVKGRGCRPCYDCANSVKDASPMLAFAKSQDVIGWDKFMLGMISKELSDLQRCHFWNCRDPEEVSTSG